MSSKQIPYRKVNTLSPLVQDYLANKSALSSFCGRNNSLENYRAQMLERSGFSTDRKMLVEVLKSQNSTLDLSEFTKNNIQSLESPDTFTVTTGHQLCLFTGPLYFIYKIVSTINLCQALKAHYTEKYFVPIFWMASEDHDFKEINHANAFGQTLSWESNQSGAVGRMDLSDFSGVMQELEALIGERDNAKELLALFRKAYSSQNLALATRILVNELFQEDGLVIIDGDDVRLKTAFVEVMKKDIIRKEFLPILTSQSELMGRDYKVQAHVREINFFKLDKGSRKRISTEISEAEITRHPEHFSPNVLMRPLYQEMLLPNLAYIGGGAEIAYWMQLKTAFESEQVPFPILVLRNSAVLTSSSQLKKIEKMGLTVEDFFRNEADLHKLYVQSQNNASLDEEIEALKKLFEGVKTKFAAQANMPVIDAEYQRQKKSLEKLAKKLYRLEKLKHETALSQISKIKATFFPSGILQERYNSFIPYYLKYGDNFIKKLKEEFDPLDSNFVVLPL